MTEEKQITAYVCGTDWQFECKELLIQTTLFNTIKELKKKKKCWKRCGIVEIKMREVCWREAPRK